MHERDFIHSLARRYPASNSVRVGIGDDGAVLDVPGNQQVVVTDMLLDGVHFDLRQHALSLVGRKSVAVNLSDLAAMGCRPTAAFVSIAIPKQSSAPAIKFPEQIYDGIDELARQFDFVVAGGDTNVWTGPFAINVCLTGVPYVASQVFLRSSARPDDVICVSGP
ncbi:MAG: thiamine-monophosphate kinase, partial [Planctomycetaceae bacterium]|nr:thiamine-monophosphate kinase [Planctomycetaceae bacterium]